MRDTIDFSQHMAAVALAILAEPTSKHGDVWRYGHHGSLAVDVKAGTFYDHENDAGGGTLNFVMQQKGIDKAGALNFMTGLGCDIPKPNGHDAKPAKAAPRFKIVQTWVYVDETGKELFEICRKENGLIGEDGKLEIEYIQRRKSEDGKEYIYNVKGVRAVPYRLPELIAAVAQGKTIFITEGEKASDAVATLGAVATTNAGGSKKIRNELVPFFKGADVVILPDNDEAGEKHLGVVAEKLRTVAARIRVLRLPGLPPKGDVFDWIAAGGTLEDLEVLVAEAEDIEPESDAAEEAAPDNVVSFLNRKVGGKGKSQRPQDNSAVAGHCSRGSRGCLGPSDSDRPKRSDSEGSRCWRTF